MMIRILSRPIGSLGVRMKLRITFTHVLAFLSLRTVMDDADAKRENWRKSLPDPSRQNPAKLEGMFPQRAAPVDGGKSRGRRRRPSHRGWSVDLGSRRTWKVRRSSTIS